MQIKNTLLPSKYTELMENDKDPQISNAFVGSTSLNPKGLGFVKINHWFSGFDRLDACHWTAVPMTRQTVGRHQQP